MATRDELLDEYARLVGELEEIGKTAAANTPIRLPPHAPSSQPMVPVVRADGSVGMDQAPDPYQVWLENHQWAVARKAAIEQSLDAIRSQLSAAQPSTVPSLPVDPITIKAIAEAAMIEEKTMRNWLADDRPPPAIEARGRRAAVYSYKSMREWVLSNRPDLAPNLPEDYSQLPTKRP